MIQRIKLLWQPIPPAYKIGGVVVVIALLITTTNRLTNYFNDRQFQKAIQVEKVLRQVDIKRADDAEAHVEVLKAEKVKLELTLELAGKSAEQAQKKVEQATDQFNKDIEQIEAPVDDCQRYQRIRQKLGLKVALCE
jgi:hypothetical protein